MNDYRDDMTVLRHVGVSFRSFRVGKRLFVRVSDANQTRIYTNRGRIVGVMGDN